jgi:DNA-binding CsgD family transcriptional regulator
MRQPTGTTQRNILVTSLKDGNEGATTPGVVVEAFVSQGVGLGGRQWEMSLLQEVSDCLQCIQGEIMRGVPRAQARQQALVQITLRIMQAASELTERGGDGIDYAPPLLTNRQREILDLMGTGMKAQTVARALRLSEQTVRSHIRDICARLGVSGIIAAIHRARALGLIL